MFVMGYDTGCVCEEHENPPDVFLDFIQERTKLSGNVDGPAALRSLHIVSRLTKPPLYRNLSCQEVQGF